MTSRSIVAMFAATSVLAAALPASASDQYDVVVRRPSARVNERAVARVEVSPKGPYHINLDFPVKLTVTAPPDVKVEKEKQTKGDAKPLEKTALGFDVAFVAKGTGKKSFAGELKFAICTDTDCKPSSEKVAFDVEVR